MLIHRISRGAHIVEMDRVTMDLQAVRRRSCESNTACPAWLAGQVLYFVRTIRLGQTPNAAGLSPCLYVGPVLIRLKS